MKISKTAGGSFMSGLVTFHLAPLSDQVPTVARTITCTWDAPLNGANALYIRDTTHFFNEKGASPIDYCNNSEKMCSHYTAFVITFLGYNDSISTHYLLLIPLFH